MANSAPQGRIFSHSFPEGAALTYLLYGESMPRKTRVRLLLIALALHLAGLPGQAQTRSAGDTAVNHESNAGAPMAPNAPAIPAVSTTLRVEGDPMSPSEALAPEPRITQQELLSAAGTFGDFVRYLQVLPGVVWKSDLSNDLIVRGGHPMENLYIVDGVEIPNINHFSLSGSNGGFTSMIDSTEVSEMEMRDGAYDSSYSSRLSSVIEIRTRSLGEAIRGGDFTLGIAGAGGLYQRVLPGNGNLLVSAHRSMLNLVTNDVGINGVPVYTNGLSRLEWNAGERDRFSLLTLSGADSITMTPCPADSEVTSQVQTQYDGWRTTEALSWRHIFTARATGEFTASTSSTMQQIGQQQQFGIKYVNNVRTCQPATLTPFYAENSRNGLSTTNYEVRMDVRGWLISVGASARLLTPNDNVAQPNGELSPFSADPLRSDADSFQRRFSTGQTATFIQVQGGLGTRWHLLAGLRAETFALSHNYALDPRISAVYRLNNRQSLHGSWNLSSQLPPTMDMLSYPGNRTLQPIAVRQWAAGMRIWQGGWGTLDAEVYRKNYRREPVSTEYPQLMLSNMIDTLGQEFVWLPLASAGTAESQGLELAVRARWRGRIQGALSAARAQTRYRALDGVRRPGNYDVPWAANAMGNLLLPMGMELDLRESFTSGRPYTPFDLADSLQQMRGIYDLARVNALRGPFYNRLDVELERRFRLRGGALEIQGGTENVLNRGNPEGYVWLTNCAADWSPCHNSQGLPIIKVDQMGRFPDISARYRF